MELDEKILKNILNSSKKIVFLLKKTMALGFVILALPRGSFGQTKIRSGNNNSESIIVYEEKRNESGKELQPIESSQNDESRYGEKYKLLLGNLVVNNISVPEVSLANKTGTKYSSLNSKILLQNLYSKNFAEVKKNISEVVPKLSNLNKKFNQPILFNLLIVSLLVKYNYQKQKMNQINLIKGGEFKKLEEIVSFFKKIDEITEENKTEKNESIREYLLRNYHLVLVFSLFSVIFLYYLQKFLFMRPRRKRLLFKKVLKFFGFASEKKTSFSEDMKRMRELSRNTRKILERSRRENKED